VSIWDETNCTLSQFTPGLVAKFNEIKKIKHLKFTVRLEFYSWEQVDWLESLLKRSLLSIMLRYGGL